MNEAELMQEELDEALARIDTLAAHNLEMVKAIDYLLDRPELHHLTSQTKRQLIESIHYSAGRLEGWEES